MKSIRIVKRNERQAENQIADSPVIRRMTTETIVKNWITASRERRNTEAMSFRRYFQLGEENMSVQES